jgi:hypothetical protein
LKFSQKALKPIQTKSHKCVNKDYIFIYPKEDMEILSFRKVSKEFVAS